ncbi:kinase-like domain-containing protein [Penicillium atrosanguineum]|uniref:non-specific serine/threonine protein kinase n=1 Tax=Penicillium atrosanguineum TaxID=1132637 RepID=A0A9W9KWC5_9EURO|nr:uncharacterized protein N7443_006552 [Penicillium atrosanguineum]KAJ5123206.1 kinase-like domain-containing protein [Penicillium atrosanguineum]KAJ5298432.1 hypothetical protein N7443_006552 [Penicillium atrosanguineum]KAJ5321299.1 kinase-like domain-containing protein [Penicillium atrosanguineum]
MSGFQPVLIGDTLKDKYRVVHKLGYGTFSTIWLANDERIRHYAAVKVGRADTRSDKGDILKPLAYSSNGCDLGRAMIPTFLGPFKVDGSNESPTDPHRV